MNPDIPKYLTMTDDIFNMIWTAGFNSGGKVNQECIDGLLASEFELKKRIDELLNQDADSIVELIKLKRQMENKGDKA